ncbi:hypothetical protein HDU84_003385 [Entophlyctis sp. JEL0112]|nr:hypothetical protein HDU84_003385 [Entophlyctis sp. JEL0112]
MSKFSALFARARTATAAAAQSSDTCPDLRQPQCPPASSSPSALATLAAAAPASAHNCVDPHAAALPAAHVPASLASVSDSEAPMVEEGEIDQDDDADVLLPESATCRAGPPPPKKRKMDKPLELVVCAVCSLKGAHHSADCDNPNGRPVNPNYRCGRCKKKGHHIRWCPLSNSTAVSGSNMAKTISSEEVPANASWHKKRPPKTYICFICSLKGQHYAPDCDNPNGTPADASYLCNICRVKGHHIKWCPKKIEKDGKLQELRTMALETSKIAGVDESIIKEKIANVESMPLKNKRGGKKAKKNQDAMKGVEEPKQSVGSLDYHLEKLRSAHPLPAASGASSNSSYIETLFSANLQESTGVIPDSNDAFYSFDLTSQSAMYNPMHFTSTTYGSIPASTGNAPEVAPAIPSTAIPLEPVSQHPLPPKPSIPLEQARLPPRLCRFYLEKRCTAGATCRFSHDKTREPCAFLNLYGECRATAGGGTCEYSHADIGTAGRLALRARRDAWAERKRVERMVWQLREAAVQAAVRFLGTTPQPQQQGALPLDGSAEASARAAVDEMLWKEFGMDFSSDGRRKMKVADEISTAADGDEPEWIRDIKNSFRAAAASATTAPLQ